MKIVTSPFADLHQKRIFVLVKPSFMQGRKPITEAGFLQEPLAQEYYDYARYVVGSMVSQVELKWDSGQSGMSLDDFVMDVVISAIELTREDYGKGLLERKNENSFKDFFWWRIKKAFYKKLEELKSDPGRAVFDERLGKYYEGMAVEFGPRDENDEPSVIDDNDGEAKIPVTRTPKRINADVILYHYSAEKAQALEENREIKMSYVRRIREIVAKMSPTDQRLFNLKFQFDFSDEDCRMWKTISARKHVKDPFTIMAHDKYGLTEGYARKRISLIKSDIIKKLKESGHTPASYRERTSVPMLEMLVVRRPEPEFDLDIENLSEADCRDILVELFS